MRELNSTQKHMAMVRRLAKPARDIESSMVGNTAKYHGMHMALGLAGEAGEVVDMIKKFVINGHGLDQDKLAEELGDVMFYVQGLVQLTGRTLDDILAENQAKLGVRYPEGYSDEASRQRRDLEVEHQIEYEEKLEAQGWQGDVA